MVKRNVLVKNTRCIHARSAVVLANLASHYDCSVTITVNTVTCDGKSVISLMNAIMSLGDEMEIICDGADEALALDALCSKVESGL